MKLTILVFRSAVQRWDHDWGSAAVAGPVETSFDLESLASILDIDQLILHGLVSSTRHAPPD